MARRQETAIAHILARLGQVLSGASAATPPKSGPSSPRESVSGYSAVRPIRAAPAIAPHIPTLVASASSHLVLPMLVPNGPGLKSAPPTAGNSGLQSGQWPPELTAFLAEMYRNNEQRNEAIATQMTEIGGLLGGAGIPAVALKGAAELIQPLFPHPGMRFMSDIDLLVPADAANDAQQVLKHAGYREPFADNVVGSGHHLPKLVRPDQPVSVELHHRVMTSRGDALLSPDDCFACARSVKGHNCLCPDPAFRMVHLIAHAQIQDSHFDTHRIRLREMAEFAVQNAALDAATRTDIAERFQVHGFSQEYQAFVAAAGRLIGPLAGMPEPDQSGKAATWVAISQRRMARPGNMRARYVFRWLASALGRLFTSRKARQRIYRIITEREVAKASLQTHLRHLSNIR